MAADLQEQGFEFYDWYHYLWHLIAIGAVRAKPGGADPDDAPEYDEEARYEIEPDAWTLLNLPDGVLPGTGETIAMIDTGVNDKHPNLAPGIKASVDFAVHPFGAVYAAEPPITDASPALLAQANVAQPMNRGLEDPLTASLVSTATWNWAKGFLNAEGDRLIDRLSSGLGVRHHDAQRSRQRYSGHGTACAGLMVGHPAAEDGGDGDGGGDSELPDSGPVPYWGVAPGAEILPIVVSAEPTAQQLIFAFLYARDQGVSVIHFPREAADPKRANRYHSDLEESRYDSDPDRQLAWDVFEKILEEVSNEIPVVCAAGNNGYDHLIYPASKADDNNGIISVAGVTYLARRSSYSNYCAEAADCKVTIATPSDDEEMYNRHEIRLDREAPGWRDHNFMLHLAANPGLEVAYAPQGLLTTDVPGPRGYTDGVLEGLSTEEQENDDRSALYTLFGGTSGASAIMAGAVALLQSKQRADTGAPFDGNGVKVKVKASGSLNVNWPWLVGMAAMPVPLSVDTPNGESAVDPEQQFGKGVIDLHQLLA